MTPTPTVTPIPTVTPTPTVTPVPTESPDPTQSPEPTKKTDITETVTKGEDGSLTTTVVTKTQSNGLSIITTDVKKVNKNGDVVNQSQNIVYQTNKNESLVVEIIKDANDKIIHKTARVYATSLDSKTLGQNIELDVSIPAELLSSSKHHFGNGNEKQALQLILPTKEINAQLKNGGIDTVVVKVAMNSQSVDSNNYKLEEIILSKDVIISFVGKDKNLTVNVDNGSELTYSWNFNKDSLAGVANQIKDVNLKLDVKMNANFVVNKDSGKTTLTGTILDFSHSGTLPGTAIISTKVVDQKETAVGSKLYLYYFDQSNNKLLELPNNEYLVGGNGIVDIAINHCSSYILLEQRPSSEYVVSLLDQIQVAKNSNVYIGGTKNWEWVDLTYPSTLKVVREFTNATDELSVSEVKIEYTSSNEKAATITNNGRIIAKSKGTTIIGIIATLPDGTTKNFQQKVVVKDANLTFKNAVSTLKLGEKVLFTVEVNGYRKEDITWKTTIEDIAVVGKNSGKTSATITTKSIGNDSVVVSVTDKNGTDVSIKKELHVTK